MILVRDIFRLKFGKAKEAKALMLESKNLMDAKDLERSRLLFDLVGHSYTMVLEGTYKNLAEFEENFGKTFKQKEWGEWYQKFIPIVEESYREIFTIIE